MGRLGENMLDVEASAHLKAANSLRAKGQTADAAAEYRKVIALVPDHVGALAALGRIARLDVDLDKALEYLRAASAGDPENYTLRLEIGHLLRRMLRLEEAFTTYESVTIDDPSNVKALTYLAVVARQRRDIPLAVKYLERALAEDPNARDAKNLLAEVHFKKSVRSAAAARHLEAVEQDPDDCRALATLARVARRAGDNEGACSYFEAAYRSSPKNLRVLCELADVYRDLDRLDDAEVAYKKALAVDGESAEALSGLGFIARARGDDEASREYLKAADEFKSAAEKYSEAGFRERSAEGDRLLRRMFPDFAASSPAATDAANNKPVLLVAPQKDANSLLITFGGNNPELWLPSEAVTLQDFHLIAIRDAQRCFSMRGVQGLGGSFRASLDSLRRLVVEMGVTDIYCTGVSAGGYSALRYALDLGANGVLAFSPPTTLDLADDNDAPLSRYPQLAALYRNKPDIPLDLARLYANTMPRPRAIVVYSATHQRDAWLAKRMAGIEGVELVEGPSDAGHRVFATLQRNNQIADYFDQLLALRPLTETTARPQ
jgi:tetratricopeptide (TPR) repeat protein